MSGYTIELACCESVLMQTIGAPEAKRKDVACVYAMSLRSSECNRVDWRRVNEAIIARWSTAALDWIKKQAWSGKCFDEPKGGRLDGGELAAEGQGGRA